VSLELGMIVDVEQNSLPLGVLVRLTRQRAQCWAIELLEQLATAHVVGAHAPVVEIDDELGNASVELGTPGSYLHATVTADLSWSGTTAAGTPPKKATARELLAIQSGSCRVYVASAYV